MDDFTKLAFDQAKIALEHNELPVGAVIVLNGQVIGSGFNRTFLDNDPTAHAEIVAIRNAAKTIGDHRLTNSSIYVTLEPCPMCVGAILLARITKIYFAAYDPANGACGSKSNLAVHPVFGWGAQVFRMPGEEESARLIREFFTSRRAK
jgi:tRNA(adenine34) deaminase